MATSVPSKDGLSSYEKALLSSALTFYVKSKIRARSTHVSGSSMYQALSDDINVLSSLASKLESL